jgi:hypothetical protein
MYKFKYNFLSHKDGSTNFVKYIEHEVKESELPTHVGYRIQSQLNGNAKDGTFSLISCEKLK